MVLSVAHAASVRSLSTATPRALSRYAYGTSGFRGLATTLDAVTLRMGMMAALRSWKVGSSAAPNPASNGHSSAPASSAAAPASPIVGVMVTASHNDAPDNGVKLIDPSGEMLDQAWEAIATRIANATEGDELVATIEAVMDEQGLSGTSGTLPQARVYIARDTRESSPHLRGLLEAGARALGALVSDFGLCTTPQLHWLVRAGNERSDRGQAPPTLDQYYETMTSAFRTALQCKLRDDAGDSPSSLPPSLPVLPPLVVDCANGVGALSIAEFATRLGDVLPLERRNTGDGGLNALCGAEHVQKSRSLPARFDLVADIGRRIASLDGDADRLVYCYVDERGFRLLDGDKIIALYTLFLRDLLAASGLASELSIGIVQTAYANGASTRYMQRTLGVDVQFTNTGVKHLHHRAVQYDIGVYFESNGHGTVVFSQRAQQLIRAAAARDQQDIKKATAVRCLNALLSLINQCIGDAVSDLLLVEVALYHRGWSLRDWDSVYEDLPSTMLKVLVKDRSVISTTNAERTCVKPPGLQDAIDALVSQGGNADGLRRAFVRPSGTEDVVRVYAEAATREEVDLLGKQVCDVVAKMAGGV